MVTAVYTKSEVTPKSDHSIRCWPGRSLTDPETYSLQSKPILTLNPRAPLLGRYPNQYQPTSNASVRLIRCVSDMTHECKHVSYLAHTLLRRNSMRRNDKGYFQGYLLKTALFNFDSAISTHQKCQHSITDAQKKPLMQTSLHQRLLI